MKTASLLLSTAALAGCATTATDTAMTAPAQDRTVMMAPVPDVPTIVLPATAAEAVAFVARAEKELGEFSLISSKAAWVNSTYITDDTDALAAHFGTIGTEMGVKFASEAARQQSISKHRKTAAAKLPV